MVDLIQPKRELVNWKMEWRKSINLKTLNSSTGVSTVGFLEHASSFMLELLF